MYDGRHMNRHKKLIVSCAYSRHRNSSRRKLNMQRVAWVCTLLLAALIGLTSANVQVGRRFPLGIELGEIGANPCDEATTGLLGLQDDVVQVCINGTWIPLTPENGGAINQRFEDLESELNALRNLSSPQIANEKGNILAAVSLCNGHGEYDTQSRWCMCDCSLARGCFDRDFLCARCAHGWTGELCRTDVESPQIFLIGGSIVTVEGGSVYEDVVVVTDNGDGDISGSVQVSGDVVDTSHVGTYVIIYSVTDSSGNSAIVQRTVVVVDTTSPTVSLIGDGTMTIGCGQWADPGFSSSDNTDNTLSSFVDSPFAGTYARFRPGTYNISYEVTDSYGNFGTAARTVLVVDIEVPIIVPLGYGVVIDPTRPLSEAPKLSVTDDCLPMSIEDGQVDPMWISETEEYATVPALSELSVFDLPVYSSDAARNTSLLGCCASGAYTYTDGSGKAAVDVSVDVEVADLTAPEIVVLGNETVTVEQYGEFIDVSGAYGTDNMDWELTAYTGSNISHPYPLYAVQSSSISTDVPGTFLVNYTFSDGAGNVGWSVRTVIVTDINECEGALGHAVCTSDYNTCENTPVGSFTCQCLSPRSGSNVGGDVDCGIGPGWNTMNLFCHGERPYYVDEEFGGYWVLVSVRGPFTDYVSPAAVGSAVSGSPTPSSVGYMGDDDWQSIFYNGGVFTDMMINSGPGTPSYMKSNNIALMKNANCISLPNTLSYVGVAPNIQSLVHHENSGCSYSGGDYSGVLARYTQVYTAATVKFFDGVSNGQTFDPYAHLWVRIPQSYLDNLQC